jgi:hypothetical protein
MTYPVLTNAELLEKSTQYNTPYGDIHICNDSKAVGIFLSGGLDSAILLYLIAKTLSENNSEAIIQPFTVNRTNPSEFRKFDRVDLYPYANGIVSYVRSKFPNANIADPLTRDADYWWIDKIINGRSIGPVYEAAFTIARFLRWKFTNSDAIEQYKPNIGDLLYVEYCGVTKNPSKEVLPQCPEIYRDDKHPNELASGSATVFFPNVDNPFYIYLEPFRNSDKRITMWIANNLGILTDLLPITRTCEGGPARTENFTKECMECWWCLEKYWTLENYSIEQK